MSAIGQPLSRLDGRAKVTGAARYATEGLPPRCAFAVGVGSTIAAGRLRSLETAAAEKAPGVLAVLTHRNAPKLGRPTWRPAGQSQPILQGPQIEYYGQFIAVVVAETFEQARHAAALVRAEYERTEPVTFANHRVKAVAPTSGRTARGTKADNVRGNVQQGMSEAAARVEATYSTPIQHHCALEPHATLAWWDGDRLVAHDATESFTGTAQLLAEVFGLKRENVRVYNEFVGGSFGGKGQSWPHVILAALAAKTVGRPVRFAPTRRQIFANAGHRGPTEQKIALGAGPDGALTATQHDSVTHTSQFDEFVEPTGQHTEVMYACPNLGVTHRIVKAHVGTPTYTRGPGETPNSFALECAMDELAIALKMDPVALRVRCDATRDESSGHPWSSRNLQACLALAAEKFGWAKRNPEPRSMREGRALIGYGMAAATLGAPFRKAEARAVFSADGRLLIQCAAHEIGVGMYTVLTQIAADGLGVKVEDVTVALGDSRFPPTPRGGSSAASSAGSAVFTAARELRTQLLDLARSDEGSPLRGLAAGEVKVEGGWAFAEKKPAQGEALAKILQRRGLKDLEAKAVVQPGPERGGPPPASLGPKSEGEGSKAEVLAFHSFGAHFCEVRVDPDLGTVRVVRWVGAFDCGRVLNPKLAASQIRGGIVWGLGNALMEETLQDRRQGAFVNADFGGYHFAANADVPPMEIHFLDLPDAKANPLGIRGIGELGNVGSAAAIANAIFHATGKRLRELPMTPERVMGEG